MKFYWKNVTKYSFDISNSQQYPAKQQQFAKQKQGLAPRRNYQQMMWHARSMESGLGKKEKIVFFIQRGHSVDKNVIAVPLNFIYANDMLCNLNKK